MLGFSADAGQSQVAAITSPVPEERRVALVLGNSAYQDTKDIRALTKPVNDAFDMAEALRGLGFEVFPGADLDYAETLSVVDDFAEAAETADVALFFYSGHAGQIEGRNVLMPVDTERTEDNGTVYYERVVPLANVIARLDRAPGVKILLLDACQNPLTGSLTTEDQTGLAGVAAGRNVFIAYATLPNREAYEGIRGRNSYFTKAVLSHIRVPGVQIEDMFKAVRRDVSADTRGVQIPWDNSGLVQDFFFDPGDVEASPETLWWQLAAVNKDPDLARLYLDRFPAGTHAKSAEALVNAPDGKASEATGNNTRQERALWQLVVRSRSVDLAREYLEMFPDGPEREAARTLIGRAENRAAETPEEACVNLALHPRDGQSLRGGVPMWQLAGHAEEAITACKRAGTDNPQEGKYLGLLARTLWADGQTQLALESYEAAIALGDMRAALSLGLILEDGRRGVPQDPERARALYTSAAHRGFSDGLINLAVAMRRGVGGDKDPEGAFLLLKEAADAGSPLAAINLGRLALQGFGNGEAQGLKYLEDAIRYGAVDAFLPAAILYDQGRGIRPDPFRAADYLLEAVAGDRGDALALLTEPHTRAGWSPDTIRAMQATLVRRGLYHGVLSGVPSAAFDTALADWRNGGYLRPDEKRGLQVGSD
ncbi:MAG: caspase family protein [Paracoccaceae bacterium]|nr:caspase family protein [Paracoccaceae bacterium]